MKYFVIFPNQFISAFMFIMCKYVALCSNQRQAFLPHRKGPRVCWSRVSQCSQNHLHLFQWHASTSNHRGGNQFFPSDATSSSFCVSPSLYPASRLTKKKNYIKILNIFHLLHEMNHSVFWCGSCWLEHRLERPGVKLFQRSIWLQLRIWTPSGLLGQAFDLLIHMYYFTANVHFDQLAEQADRWPKVCFFKCRLTPYTL